MTQYRVTATPAPVDPEERNRITLFTRIRDGQFEEIMASLPTQPAERICLLQGTGLASKKNVFHWVASYLSKKVNQEKWRRDFEFKNGEDAASQFFKEAAEFVDCGKMVVARDNNEISPLELLLKLPEWHQTTFFSLIKVTVGTDDLNADITGPLRHLHLWSMIQHKQGVSNALVLGPGFMGGAVSLTKFSESCFFRVSSNRNGHADNFSPECYELACLFPNMSIDVLDQSSEGLQASDSLPAQSYFPQRFHKVCDQLSEGHNRLLQENKILIGARIKHQLSVDNNGFVGFPIPKACKYDIIMAANILLYPLQPWLFKQNGTANKTAIGSKMIASLAAHLSDKGTLCIDAHTCREMVRPNGTDADTVTFIQNIIFDDPVRLHGVHDEKNKLIYVLFTRETPVIGRSATQNVTTS